MLASVPEEDRSDCWWLILRDSMPVRGDRGGGVLLLAEVRLTRRIGRTLGVLRLSRFIDALDVVLARYRQRLGRFVPDGPAPRRFP